ncbi:MAG TPA: T9SS type A sorting domain-containing protein [Candidatus Krumholzibacteria bacterium]|nr:T9SS type A sorting domain-containing protein [Candidatus Krumholzibacteria bacterium]
MPGVHTTLFVTAVLVSLAVGPAARAQQAPPCSEGELIALEYFGDLVADPFEVAVIEDHLAAIRDLDPRMADVQAAALEWVPGSVMVKLTDDARADFDAGIRTGFDDLGDELGVSGYRTYTTNPWMAVYFDEPLHPERLVELYETLPEVVRAELNAVAGDASDVTRLDDTRYVFRIGSGDCPSGCIDEQFYFFEVENGTAALLAQTDAPANAPEVSLQPARPNPFNPATSIAFDLPREGRARIEVYDLRGRHVATLLDAVRPAGRDEVIWRGTDASGRAVASGVYVVRLQTEAGTDLQRVTLAK